MSKEIYIAAHEALIDEYLERHPDADWTEAYERTADNAWVRMQDKFADMIDNAKDRA